MGLPDISESCFPETKNTKTALGKPVRRVGLPTFKGSFISENKKNSPEVRRVGLSEIRRGINCVEPNNHVEANNREIQTQCTVARSFRES